jgi:hypothetical protein
MADALRKIVGRYPWLGDEPPEDDQPLHPSGRRTNEKKTKGPDVSNLTARFPALRGKVKKLDSVDSLRRPADERGASLEGNIDVRRKHPVTGITTSGSALRSGREPNTGKRGGSVAWQGVTHGAARGPATPNTPPPISGGTLDRGAPVTRKSPLALVMPSIRLTMIRPVSPLGDQGEGGAGRSTEWTTRSRRSSRGIRGSGTWTGSRRKRMPARTVTRSGRPVGARQDRGSKRPDNAALNQRFTALGGRGAASLRRVPEPCPWNSCRLATLSQSARRVRNTDCRVSSEDRRVASETLGDQVDAERQLPDGLRE